MFYMLIYALLIPLNTTQVMLQLHYSDHVVWWKIPFQRNLPCPLEHSVHTSLKADDRVTGARGSRTRSIRANICYKMYEISCLDLKQLWFSHPVLSKVHRIHKGSRLMCQVELHKIPNSRKSNVHYQLCWNTDLQKSMLGSACTQTWFARIHYKLLLAIKKLNFKVLNYTSLGFVACT